MHVNFQHQLNHSLSYLVLYNSNVAHPSPPNETKQTYNIHITFHRTTTRFYRKQARGARCFSIHDPFICVRNIFDDNVTAVIETTKVKKGYTVVGRATRP